MSSELYYRNAIQLKASPAEVWNALVDPEKTAQYMFGCNVISDWQIGNSVVWRGAADQVDYVVGTLTIFKPGSELAFTVFDPNGKYHDTPENYLTTHYILEANDNGTLLRVSQGDYSKVDQGEERFKHNASWDQVLQDLKSVVERVHH